MFRVFAVGRSLAGIYLELRHLRLLAEAWFEQHGIPLPETPFDRFRRRLSASTAGQPDQPADAAHPDIDEERDGRVVADKIIQDIAAGRDPGTEWRPWS